MQDAKFIIHLKHWAQKLSEEHIDQTRSQELHEKYSGEKSNVQITPLRDGRPYNQDAHIVTKASACLAVEKEIYHYQSSDRQWVLTDKRHRKMEMNVIATDSVVLTGLDLNQTWTSRTLQAETVPEPEHSPKFRMPNRAQLRSFERIMSFKESAYGVFERMCRWRLL